MQINKKNLRKQLTKKIDEEELVKNSIEHSDLYKQIKELLDSGVLDKDSDKTNSGLCSSEVLGTLNNNKGFMTKKNNLVPKEIYKIQKRQELQENDVDEDVLVEPIEIDDDSFEEDEEFKEIDTLTFDVPLFLRMLEYAKEDAKSDLDLHFVTENCLLLSKECDVLTMSDYEDIVDIGENTECDGCKIGSFDVDEDPDMVQIYEKKKKHRKKMLRRGYGYIWPLYPMGPFFPPGPRPPKPPKPEPVPDPEPVTPPTTDVSSGGTTDAGSVADVSGAVDAGAGVAAGGDAGGGGVAAGVGGAGGGAAVAEAKPEDANTENPISRTTKNRLLQMTTPYIEKFVADNYFAQLGNPRNVDNFKDKITALELYSAPDQTVFIKVKNEADDKVWIVHAGIDDEMKKLSIPDNWDDLNDHVFSDQSEIIDKFEYETVTPIWSKKSEG